MMIFPGLYFLVRSRRNRSILLYLFSNALLYAAFTFTFSRGATLGLLSGLISFIIFYSAVLYFFDKSTVVKKYNNFRPLLIGLLIFLIINLFFGSAITRFKLLKGSTTPIRPTSPAAVTQLEAGGTESGQIRLIVWRGALEVFKHNPWIGSGVETFAYSYYGFRPVEHNLVSEWDFLYNKAHNEFLNYLATTGAIGLVAYILMIPLIY